MPYDSAVAQLYELGHELARTPTHKFEYYNQAIKLDPKFAVAFKNRGDIHHAKRNHVQYFETPILIDNSIQKVIDEAA